MKKFDEIMRLLLPRYTLPVRAQSRSMRETHHAQYVVKDYADFEEAVHLFYDHYMRCYFGAHPSPCKGSPEKLRFCMSQALEWSRRLLADYPGGYFAAERNSILGRHNGLPFVLDHITNAVEQQDIKYYIEVVLRDNDCPPDSHERIKFARQYIECYGKRFLTDETLLHEAFLTFRVDEVLLSHVIMLEGMGDHIANNQG